MVESPPVAQSGPAETRLVSCLTLLNPPYEDYSGLADCMSRLLRDLDDETRSQERTLAAYFELFGHGYAEWQTCYDYHVIHEYFFGAYLRALREGEGRIDKNTLDMLDHMTDAMIAYSNCENAVISNDPKSLFHWSSRAAASGAASLEAVEGSSLSVEAKNELHKYIAKNLHLFLGLRTCAAMHLAAGGGDPVLQDDHEQVCRSIDFLKLN